MGKTKVKTFLISFLIAACAACACVAFAACSGGEDTGSKHSGTYNAGEEGIYYWDLSESEEYILNMQSGVYTVTMGSVTSSAGTYLYDTDGGVIHYTDNTRGTEAQATFSDGYVSFTEDGGTYLFQKRVEYAVTFAGVDGAVVAVQSVRNGKAAEYVDAEEDGYVFLGWYSDAGLTVKYAFDGSVTGDMTLYGRYILIDESCPVYEITFVNGDAVTYGETVNGCVVEFPEADVLGWWVCATGDAAYPTYKYDGEELKENTVLVAVGNETAVLGASVYEDGIVLTNTPPNGTITISMGGEVVGEISLSGRAEYAFDFGELPCGVYIVEISAAGYADETLAFVNKGLSKVSGFEVLPGDILVYSAVENATAYYVMVTCGKEEHDLYYNGTSLYYDFSACEMGPEGISFTVYAYATGYLESVSDTFTYKRVLDGITDLAIDSSSDEAVWSAVEGAVEYKVYVDGEYADTVTGTSYSFKYYEKGTNISVSVEPVAPGYWSEVSKAVTYEKITFATPQNIIVGSSYVSWDAVEGADGYSVKVNGEMTSVDTATTFLITDTGADIYEISVRAYSASDSSFNSQWSDTVLALGEGMTPAISYANGKITWDYVLYADKYYVTVNDGDETESTSNTCEIKFTQSGNNEIKVRFETQDGGSAYASLTVYAYAIIFDTRGGDEIETMYVAKGDAVYVDDPEYSVGMADFKGWYTLPNLSDDPDVTEYTAGGKEFVSGDVFEGTGTVILYAFWINRQVAITLDAGDGKFIADDGTETSVKVEYISYNSSTFTLSVPTTPDATMFFMGWYTAEVGGVQYTDSDGKAVVLYNNLTITNLYAHWGEAVSLSLTTYQGETVLSVSKGSDISKMTSGVLYLDETYVYGGVEYPVGVILSGAFADATRLTEIYIPDTVVFIETANAGYASGSGAFAGCSNLTAVNIYATGVGEEDTTKEIHYYSEDGVLFQKDMTTDELTLIYYPHAKADASYTVPSVVKSDAEYVMEGATAVLSEGHPVTALATQVFAAGVTTTTYRMKMTEITIPASVRTVSSQCFYYSANLEKITFLEADAGVTATLTIGSQAFARCTGLSDLTLPSHLESFDLTAFDNCTALTEVKITSGGTYSSTDGSASTKGLICADGGKTVVYGLRSLSGELVVGNDITKIADKAFNGCTSITKVTIGSTVTYIGESAFEGCTGIESLEFLGDDNSGDLTIKTKAFYGLTNSAFTTLTLPCNLVTLEQYAFGNCQKLTTVYFDGRNTGSVYATYELEFATGAFANDNGTTYYVTTLYLGANVPYFAFTAVFGTSLSNVYIDEDNLYFGTGEDGVVYNVTRTEIYFYPDDLEGAYELPYGLERIGDNVFSKKTKLTGITIPSTVTYIGYQAFYGCTSLAYVTFTTPEEDAEKNLGDDYDEETDLEVQSLVIGDKAFYNCSALTSITLPARLVEMGEYDSMGNLVSMDVFTGCNKLETIVVEEGNENFMTEDGILYLLENGEATDLILSPRKNTVAQGELVIPETVSKIWYRAFYYNEGITKISFENNTAVNGLELDTQITYYSEIQDVILPYGTTSIPYECFYYSKNIEHIYVPYTVTTIDTYAFYYCSSLTDIEFGDVPDELAEQGVEAEGLEFGAYKYEFGGYYFYGTAITELVIPDRTTSIHDEAFYGMSKLTSVTIGAGLEELAYQAFYNDSNLTEVKFAENGKLTKINEYAFANTGALSIETPSSLREIESYAFYTSGITYVKLNKEITNIAERAFGSCRSLSKIEFEEPDETDYTLSMTVENNAFYYTAITEITLPYYMTTIGGFYYNLSLATLNFADMPEEYVLGTEDGHEAHEIVLGERAFYNCSALTSLTIPWYISALGDSSLAVCTKATAVTFDETVHASLLTTIDSDAFYNSKAFTEIAIPATVETIGAAAFSGCTALASITFETDENDCSALKSIGKNAFLKTAITSFAFPKIDLTKNPDGFELGEGLFKQCTALTTVTLSNGVIDLGTSLNFCYSITTIVTGDDCNFRNSEDGEPILYSADGFSIVFTYGEISGSLVIPEGVSEIGADVFLYQNSMTSVTIPSTVVTIGDEAFYGCTALESVYFAANTDSTKSSALTTLGKYAFAYCTSLTEIELPDSVTSFKTYAFAYCSSLKEITIPAGVDLYDKDNETASNRNNSYDFRNCTSLEKVIFKGVPTGIGSYAFYECYSLKTVGINGTCTDGVVDLSGMADGAFFGNSAFAESGVEKVKLPATNFGTPYGGSSNMTKTFNSCASLKEITFGQTAKSSLCSGMFVGCTSLEKVSLPEDGTLFTGTSNSTGVFCNCTSLKTVVTNGTTIETYTFYGCTALTTMASSEETLKENVADMSRDVDMNGSKGYTFYNCSSLSFVVMPDECSIGTYMFFGTTSLKTVTNETKYENNKYLQGIADLSDVSSFGTYAFSASGIESLIFPALNSTSTSAAAIFMNCESLKTVTFSEGAITLSKSAFAGCTSLETITLRSDMTITAGTATSAANQGVFAGSGVKTVLLDGVTSLPNYTFYGCFNLTTLASVTDDNYTRDSDGNLVLDENTIHQDVIDLTSVTSVGTYEFQDCTSITTVVYPSTLTSTSNYEFSGCTSLTTFAILTAGEDGTYDFTKIEVNVVDLSSITTMGTNLFQSCESITKVILPETVTTITAYAFDGCTSLVTIGETDSVADLTGVTAMNNYAFQNTGITELVLGKQTSSNSAQFYECADLEKVTLTENITIGKAMFAGCSSLKEITAEAGVTATITAGSGGSSASTVTNKGAFCDCVSLEKFDVTAAAINAYTFYNCTSLKEIDLSAYTTTGNYAFYGCSSLEKVEMPLATSLGTYAFYGCSGVTEMNLPLVTALPNYAFYGCVSLESASVPSVTSVGNYTFYGCVSLGGIGLTSVTTIGNYAFYGCTAMTAADISAATSVGDYSFYGSGLTTLNIPAALDTIGTAAFGGCSSLSTITVENGNNVYEEMDGFVIDYVNSVIVFAAGGMTDVVTPDGVAEIGEYAFYGFEGDSLTLSDDVTYIGQYAFAYATFDDVTLSKNLETIDSYAFYFTGIENISIPASVTTIGDYAFSGDGSTDGSGASRVVVINGYSSLKSVTFEEFDNEDEDLDGEKELSIGKYSFAATMLESVSLPDRLTEMGEGALLGTTYMKTITFGTGLTVLPNYVLAGSGIVNLEVPEWITEIGNAGCIYMEDMETLTLHDGMVTINQYCFMHAAKLTEVSIPGTATYVGTYCFSSCEMLETAVYEDGCTTTGVNQVFKYDTNLKSVTLPDTLVTLSAQCFEESGLKSIIVPRSVESIGDKAFVDWDETCYIYLGYESPFESLRMCGYAVKSAGTNDYESWRDNCVGANIYYYSASQPAAGSAVEYWHYDADGVTPVAWNV